MDNVLRKIETEEIIFYRENQYSPENKAQFLSVFRSLKDDGVILSEYADPAWTCYSGVRMFTIDYELNDVEYSKHTGKRFGISLSAITDMLKCFVIYSCGEYIFKTIQNHIRGIKHFLETFGEPLHLTDEELDAVREFLAFIGTSPDEIESMTGQVHVLNGKEAGQRELANIINYLAIENEISDLYRDISDQEFVHWFPIYFWTKVTFILPLRATEMLLTPYHCVRRTEKDVFLTIRRTMLKKWHNRVYYDVEKDYKVFEYRIPDSDTVKNIEKYQALTAAQDRRYLFEHSRLMTNHMLSLPAFNHLLESFVGQHLIGNRKYDYAKYASGIKEFRVVTAGDSRPIAMANLFYQDMGADICRQLADHTSISVSYGYFTNVSNTVLAASVMHMQREINRDARTMEAQNRVYQNRLFVPEASFCSAPSNPKLTGDISPCIAEDFLEDCMGCRYYCPSEMDLRQSIEKRKDSLDKAGKKVLEYMVAGTDLDGADFDKVFLDAHTGIIRYKIACDEKAEMEKIKWERYRSSTTNC